MFDRMVTDEFDMIQNPLLGLPVVHMLDICARDNCSSDQPVRSFSSFP